ncbi:DUF1624 domain-containing protein [Planktotalea arctica]|uniref:DUF1624 domain-containing protein n=1 Tax=Planktotalea arctica TaxID=1481893 RepID=UPI000A175FB0|nr:heparan-alpha-glucosaminide N-acetyltransferase [Planktotalea arctica]
MRIAVIDIARTAALAAMVVFHFTYDLELFGFAPRGTIASREWVLFAQAIAGSFIFLSGVSLVLAAQGGPLDRGKYLKRLAMIGAAAIAVSLGTYVAMGSAFVRFGILHILFCASILGLVFLRRGFWLAGLFGIVVVALPHTASWPFVNSVYLLWLGATIEPLPAMVDYIPLIPWFGVFLLGMSFAQLVTRLGAWGGLAGMLDPARRGVRLISWPGKHSLAVYLIHQPVLFGGVYLAKVVLG